jgi:outer membrane protein assembly factor BamA
MNWGLQGYHTAGFIQENYDPAAPGVAYPVARFTSYGLTGMASYPFNRFTRIDINTTAAVFQKDVLVDLDIPTKTKYAIFPQISYVHDDVLWSYFYPRAGTRYNLGISAAPKLSDNWLGFITPSLDFRHYFKLADELSLATRIAGAASFGPTPQKFFIGGVSSWINRFFKDVQTLTEPEDYAFFTPGEPLRGYAYNERIGTKYVLGNLELRYPFPIIVGGFPLAFFGDAFIDAGTAWNKNIYLFQRDITTGNWVTKDLLLSTGTGIRTYLFGFYGHLDIAWTTNLQEWSHPVWLLSIGEDF